MEHKDAEFGHTLILEAPKCIGCNKEVFSPSDAQWNLFRVGLIVHNKEECINAADKMLTSNWKPRE